MPGPRGAPGVQGVAALAGAGIAGLVALLGLGLLCQSRSWELALAGAILVRDRGPGPTPPEPRYCCSQRRRRPDLPAALARVARSEPGGGLVTPATPAMRRPRSSSPRSSRESPGRRGRAVATSARPAGSSTRGASDAWLRCAGALGSPWLLRSASTPARSAHRSTTSTRRSCTFDRSRRHAPVLRGR